MPERRSSEPERTDEPEATVRTADSNADSGSGCNRSAVDIPGIFSDHGLFRLGWMQPIRCRYPRGHCDEKGSIWMAYGFFRYDCQGLDAHGNPICRADKITVMEPPKGIKKVARVCYDTDTDTLVVAEEGEDIRRIDRVYICRNYLAGNRETVSFAPGAGKEAGCMTMAGDYIFTGGWKGKGRVWVNRLSDGAWVGVLAPGPTVGGIDNTGGDVLTGITAMKRKNGEYLVFIEEDYRAKSILYRCRLP